MGYRDVQETVSRFFQIAAGIWLVLVAFAFLNTGEKAIGFVFPLLGQKVNPFAREQIGGGLSAFSSLAHYLYILVGAGFGVVAAISMRRRIFQLAVLGCLLVWPYFLVGRTRSSIVAVCLPGILTWVFFRFRGSNLQRAGILAAVFFMFNVWFLLIMEARGMDVSVMKLLFQSDITSMIITEARHLGLNMYQELCWLTTFMKTGLLSPNWGERFFAELVNPIPRALWPGKPTIGLDYAVVRGQMIVDSKGTVSGTVSTGLIGQGVQNFGIFGGPLASGLLMHIWANILATIDTYGKITMRIPLFCIGLVLTFNMGRDITLLVLYPFVFGWVAIVFWERKIAQQQADRAFG